MRYLNKIIFINSANIAYAEIGIAGNVHFIGTQGVGKSTILRAILFFYNADKTKLGIEKGKRSFDDYYLPHGNSFIVYEVVTETGLFCVLAYKSQGRVAFRFIDGAYDRANYISTDHKAMIWDQVRNTFSGTSVYTRKIERYEEYRDILYGNNKGLPAQFRKYAMIESRQYQNLPRTIQNVFLNSKLEAEFIKQTIIMSLNEEDIKIDLDQYALHLKNFEQQLSDIGKWTERSRSGEVVVRILADKIAGLHKTVGFLEQEKVHLVRSLFHVHSSLEQAYPGYVKRLDQHREKHAVAVKKVEEADQKFRDKRDKINKEITLMDAKLTEIRRKTENYDQIGIHRLIERVARRSEWESRKTNKQAERALLVGRYQEITNKYEALALQLQNQLDQFINEKNTLGNDVRAASYLKKEEIRKQYDKIMAAIEREHADIKKDAEAALSEKRELVHQLELKKKEAELKRWFENELVASNKAIVNADQKLLVIKNERSASRTQIESLQKNWDLDVKRSEVEYTLKREKIEAQIVAAGRMAEENAAVIANSRNSFYEWLHENKPGWEQSVGKVVDQRSVLFNSGLSPKMVQPDHPLIYGVELDLSGVTSDVKSIADYEQEIQQLNNDIAACQVSLAALTEEQMVEADKLKKKYQPQIRALKDSIALREYEETKLRESREASILERDEWLRKAESEQKAEVTTIKAHIVSAIEERSSAEEQLLVFQKTIKKRLDDKKKERDQRLDAEDQALHTELEKAAVDIAEERNRIVLRKKQIDEQGKKALENEGADVARITALDQELTEVEAELEYIEANRDQVAEYNKDKRELFDHVDDFKAAKKLAETKLSGEQQRYEAGKAKLQETVDQLNEVIKAENQALREMGEDLKAFEDFSKTDTFLRLADHFDETGNESGTSLRLTKLIAAISDKINEAILRMNDLRGSINRFLSNFSSGNIFGFETSLIDDEEYLRFADSLSEFLEENKIEEYEKRTNELFATLVFQVSKETTELVSKEAIINKVINDINRDFVERNFAGVIRGIELRMSPSANKIVTLLQEIRLFNNDYAISLGGANLFSNDDTVHNNKRAVSYLKSFAAEIAGSKQGEVTLSDTFELQFRIVENENDSGWVEKLTNVGSEGTDVLVKAMINIMLLNVFKENASKRFRDFRLHCMMDEIGKLHPNNVKGILKFANDRNIMLINSSPTSYNAVDYKHTYLLTKDSKHATLIKRLITNNMGNATE
ncbi:uncharacterized protein DUF3584 [Arcticibacter tournemirensis]|uniref:ATP-binding protein n=1 Tax=Arcticibacter tournemirensis TaxID=699437 RepID=A0A5M9HA72_9SPHI|nr:ATP-binding protein [Arcticibacter tournemirensis]KAA8483125.1 ATP-binding protein [Arcticibacter tournemirensis]TQM51961.1 uncharacterized protein DUF3584 [Arcticibacter tournemirensis]